MEQKKKPDLTFDSVPAAHAQWAWEHEVVKEFVSANQAHYRGPAWAEYELAKINHESVPDAGPFSPITLRGAVVGEAVPGCEHVTISIGHGTSHAAIRRAVDRWLERRPEPPPPSPDDGYAHKDSIPYVEWLRDLAVVRCYRAGLTWQEAEEAIECALSEMGIGPAELTRLTRGIRKHYQEGGNYHQNHSRHLAHERARVHALLAAERREEESERHAAEDAQWRADLAAAEAAGDKKLAARIREIAGL